MRHTFVLSYLNMGMKLTKEKSIVIGQRDLQSHEDMKILKL